jgi:hypothetical protein
LAMPLSTAAAYLNGMASTDSSWANIRWSKLFKGMFGSRNLVWIISDVNRRIKYELTIKLIY